MARDKFTIHGMRELDAALGALGKATGRAVLRRTLRKIAKPLVEQAKAYAPYLSGDLEASIHAGTRAVGADAGREAYAEVLGGGGSKGEAVAALRAARRESDNAFAEIHVGPGRNPQAIQQEFGNVNHDPDPFMRPAWDATKGGMVDQVARELWIEIEKTAARKAKRDAKRTGG